MKDFTDLIEEAEGMLLIWLVRKMPETETADGEHQRPYSANVYLEGHKPNEGDPCWKAQAGTPRLALFHALRRYKRAIGVKTN